MKEVTVPTYSYECKKCGHAFELFHGMNESPRVKCGECGGISQKMIGTGAGIIFKGSGFYETDYKKKSGSPDAAPAAKSETKTEGKSDSGAAKPEPASTPKTSTETPKKKTGKAASAKD